ncbi:MAG: hypothetical protein AAFQ94_22545 [Bacteroidota bacterium]
MRDLTKLFIGLLFAIAFLLAVGCQQENQEVIISNDVIISEATAQIPPMDEGLLRHYATLSMQMMYQVDVLPHQIEKLNKNELTTWIAQNEVNKSAIINATNQHILSILLQQGHVDAVKVTSPFHSEFTESVYVIIPEIFVSLNTLEMVQQSSPTGPVIAMMTMKISVIPKAVMM